VCAGGRILPSSTTAQTQVLPGFSPAAPALNKAQVQGECRVFPALTNTQTRGLKCVNILFFNVFYYVSGESNRVTFIYPSTRINKVKKKKKMIAEIVVLG
jgi:hypothetical protein